MAKVATAVGYGLRMSLNCEWRMANTLGRTVAIRKLLKEDTHFHTCQDCGNDANWVVVELTRFTPAGRRKDYPLVWGWCGVCDIGKE